MTRLVIITVLAMSLVGVFAERARRQQHLRTHTDERSLLSRVTSLDESKCLKPATNMFDGESNMTVSRLPERAQDWCALNKKAKIKTYCPLFGNFVHDALFGEKMHADDSMAPAALCQHLHDYIADLETDVTMTTTQDKKTVACNEKMGKIFQDQGVKAGKVSDLVYSHCITHEAKAHRVCRVVSTFSVQFMKADDDQVITADEFCQMQEKFMEQQLRGIESTHYALFQQLWEPTTLEPMSVQQQAVQITELQNTAYAHYLRDKGRTHTPKKFDSWYALAEP